MAQGVNPHNTGHGITGLLWNWTCLRSCRTNTYNQAVPSMELERVWNLVLGSGIWHVHILHPVLKLLKLGCPTKVQGSFILTF